MENDSGWAGYTNDELFEKLRGLSERIGFQQAHYLPFRDIYTEADSVEAELKHRIIKYAGKS